MVRRIGFLVATEGHPSRGPQAATKRPWIRGAARAETSIASFCWECLRILLVLGGRDMSAAMWEVGAS